MGRLLLLEPFDQPVAAVDIPPSAAWLEGHAAGLAEGVATANAQQAALREDVAQALLDLSFTYAEARKQVLVSLNPLFTTIIDRFLPDMARQSLVPLIVDQLLAAAATDATAPMRIRVHPAVAEGLRDAIPPAVPLPFVIEPDPDLIPGQAQLSQGDAETTLDLDGMLMGIRTAMAAFFDETERKIHHG